MPFARILTTLAALMVVPSLTVIWAQNPPTRLPDVADPPGTTMIYKTAVKKRDPGAAKLPPEPAPDAVPVRVAGKVKDLRENPVAGATVYLIGTRLRNAPRMEIKSAVAATATTQADGTYTILDAKVPTSAYTNTREAQTPFAEFMVVARAKGYGVGWNRGASTYAVGSPDPEDIQGRLPLESLCTLDIYFRPEADLKGRVVDENGKPVAGVKVVAQQVDLLDDQGKETVFTSNFQPELLPDGYGRSETDRDGRFRIAGLPSESCCWLFFQPAGAEPSRALYASTSAREKTTHPEPSPQQHTGRGKHEVYPADMTLTMPRARRLAVRLVADDDGKPVPDAQVYSLGETLATGVSSGGTTDAEGKVDLNLPPGAYGGLVASPASTDSRFIRTYKRPLVVTPEPAIQPLELRMTPGVELLLEAVDGATGRGIPGVPFETRPEGAGDWAPLQKSTFFYDAAQTDADGKFRAVLAPAAGKRFQVRPAAPQAPPDGWAYEPVEGDGTTFESQPGKTVRARFTLKAK